jgi:O-methyltransferase
MFYGKLDPPNQAFLDQAIERFKGIFSSVFAGDNVILFQRALGFRQDPRFVSALRKNARTRQEASLELRLNTLVWAANHALNVEGDFVECGVWRGFCFGVVTDYLNFAQVPKTLYLYDTFDGIPEELDSEKHNSPVFSEAGLYERVVARFAPYPNVRVVRGIVPNSFAEAVPERISFLHLDMNSSKSEIAALEVLFDRVTPGGLIVFDDYGWLGYGAQKKAEDLYMAQRGYHILELPSGQGMLLKR